MPNNSPILANPDSSSGNSIHSFQHVLSQISGEGSAMKLSEYTDDEIRAEVNRLKNIYVEWKAYQQGARELMVQELQKNWVDIQHIEQGMSMCPPEARETFSRILAEKQAWGAQREADINSLDAQVPGARELMNERFRWMYTKAKDLLSAEVYERGWPTFEVCQDLNLPGELVNLVLNPRIAGDADESKENDELMQLRRLVKTLEDKLEAKMKRENSMTAIATSGQVKLSDEIRERRKRIHPPVFGGGSIQAAKDWIIEYKSVAEHLKFTQQERLDDMAVRFKSVALTWYSYLLPEVKNDWDSLERAFLEYFAGGENTLETALNELRNMRQGKTQMSMFGQKLREVARRAGIHNDKVLIGYLKQSVNPEMKRAIIYRGPTTYAAAVNICIEVETDLLQLDMSKVSISPSYSSTPGIPGVYGDVSGVSGGVPAMAAQNYQDRRTDRSRGDKKNVRCFRCKKMGHVKKDCKVKLQDRQKQNQQVVRMSHQDEDVNIFSQFMNSQQEVNTKRQGRRFHIDIMADSGEELKALVDTGSTISSVSQVTARRLGLEPGEAEPMVIQYGDLSTQISVEEATLKFVFNKDNQSKVALRIVEKQNEELILGMDWFDEEDVILYPRRNQVALAKSFQNSAAVIEDIIKDKYPKLIEEEEHQTLTNVPYQYRIETIHDAVPFVGRDYRRSVLENKVITEEVSKMLSRGVVRPSESDWCSPVVLIKKPDGSYRFCVDYRGLNKLTIKDKYPIPRISELLDQLHNSTYFSTIDLKSGYWQLPLAEKDRKKTAFVADGRLFEFTCLPFGVSNGPSHFMRFMHTVLKGLPRCMVYLDDVILHSRTEEEHLEDLHRVLERLQSCNLKISLNKCQFFQPEVKFLGFLVSGAGIRSNPERTKVIKTWPTPTGTKALMRFLGFCVFYHKFIRDLSLTAKPLYNLLKKDVPFDWSPAAQEAFEKLKTQIMEMPTPAYPNPNQPYDLHCDASNVGLGAALVQGGRPIAFASRTLAPAEENYHTTEKECLAVRWALDHFHPLVHGAKLTVHTDHAALKSILSTKTPKGRIARWIMELQSYQFDIVHKKGFLNTDADALSRLEQQDSQDPAVFGPQELKAIQLADPEIKLLLKRGMVKPFAWKNELVTRQLEDKTYKPVIPRVIVPWILKKCHDDPISGHFGVARTIDKVKEVGWWFQMKQDVETWVKHCEACQRRKIRTDSTTPGMKPITPTYLGEIWASDVAVLVDSKKGNKYMLVFMEYLSKWIVTAALPSFDSDHVIQVLLYEVVLKFGVPTRLITDNGSNYISEAMKQVCQRLGIRRSLTSVEHPQTDGLVERINRTLKTSLATCADQDALNWDEYLPFVTFAYNTAKQESTKFSPFEVMFGRKPQLPLLPYTEDKLLYETEPWAVYLKNHIPLVHGKALENIKKAQLRQKRAYNKGSKVKYDYKAGDLVARKVLIKTGFPKERWSGPWVIIKASNPEATAFHIHVKGDPNNKSTANAKFMRPWFAQDERIALVSESPSGRGDGVTFRL